MLKINVRPVILGTLFTLFGIRANADKFAYTVTWNGAHELYELAMYRYELEDLRAANNGIKLES